MSTLIIELKAKKVFIKNISEKLVNINKNENIINTK